MSLLANPLPGLTLGLPWALLLLLPTLSLLKVLHPLPLLLLRSNSRFGTKKAPLCGVFLCLVAGACVPGRRLSSGRKKQADQIGRASCRERV